MATTTAKRRGFIILAVLLGIVVIAGSLVWWNFLRGRAFNIPQMSAGAQAQVTSGAPLVVSLAQGLNVPWALDFLPDGSIIFTERPGNVRLIDSGGALVEEPLITLSDVAASGEGGLLGIALHPRFEDNGYVYLYHTYQSGSGLANRVLRFTLEDRTLSNQTTILEGIPGASIHDGGRIKFGPDDKLYITAGDSSASNLAQDVNSPAGKILRLNDDGSIPEDNPFPDSPVYSYGHRNPEGITWDDQGRLWETEHGSSATDEVNLVMAGLNYGWPIIRGNEVAQGMEVPIIQSGSDTWAPTDIVYYNGSLYFTGLRGESLFQVTDPDSNPTLVRHFGQQFGRLREVVIGPDGLFYIFTNNRDGRGVPGPDDDQLLRVNPDKL